MPEATLAYSDLTFARWLAGVMRRWRIVAGVTFVALILAAVTALLVPPVYRSEASFVSNASSSGRLQGLGAVGGSVGDLFSELGAATGDPSESPNFYVQLLASRELLTRLLESRFPNPRTAALSDSATLLEIMHLREGNPARRLEKAIKQIRKNLRPGWDVKTNLVWFSVDAQWPALSAAIANRLIDLVGTFNRETRVSRAKSKRIFIELRLDSAEAELRRAEGRLRSFYEQNRAGTSSPALRFEEQQIKRSVDIANELYLTLQRQLEIARLDEFNDAALITVIDSAVPPRKAEWPRYGALAITALLLGLVCGVLVAGSIVILEDWRARNPDAWLEFTNTTGGWRRGGRGARPSRPQDSAEQTDESISRIHRPVA
ncbi:MAG TPA: hypothetical protein VIF83_07790 [Gemmatimonadaceae bacterium]